MKFIISGRKLPPPYIFRGKSDPEKRKLDHFNRWMLGATIFGVIVVAASTAATMWMGFIMREQLNVMAAQQRPWVAAELIPRWGLQFDEVGNVKMLFDVRTKNVGSAAAVSVYVISEMIFSADFQDIEAIQEKLCDRSAYEISGITRTLGGTLFPNEERTWLQSATLRAAEATAHKSTDESIAPIVVGCVVYRFYVVAQSRQTRFAYSVKRVDSDAAKRFGLDPDAEYLLEDIQVGQSVRREDLRFIKSVTGNGYAD